MDLSIRDRKLRRAYEAGSKGWHQPAVVKRFEALVSAFDAASTFEDVKALTQFDAHPLEGKRAGQWALKLSGNFRAIIELGEDEEGPYADLIEVTDYH